MKLTDEIRIEAPREVVYAALNDPEILKQSIPGCETLEKVSENEFAATVRAKVGPVRARFNGAVTLSDLDPPNGYTLSGEGKGGAAGFARGSARVELAEDGDATILRYSVDATVGGKLAQLGGRLIDSTAKAMAAEFFRNFQEAVASREEREEEIAAEKAETVRAPRPAPPVQTRLIWILAAAAAVVVILYALMTGGGR
ncbi:MAG: hypothetical protein Kow0032_12110 [Methyloligellaceae bacterium]